MFAGINPEGFDINNPVGTNLAYYLDPDTTTAKFVRGMASSLDLINIWSNDCAPRDRLCLHQQGQAIDSYYHRRRLVSGLQNRYFRSGIAINENFHRYAGCPDP